jgi:hypothetical protein
MSPSTIPTTPQIRPVNAPTAPGTPTTAPNDVPRPAASATAGAAAVNGAAANGAAAERVAVQVPSAGSVPDHVIDNLAVRIAVPEENDTIAQLATRAGSPRPKGALMVGAVDERLLAAVSMSTGEVVKEPTPSGEAAAAVVRYRVSRLGRRPVVATAR